MAFYLTANITIGNKSFRFANSVEITSDSKKITDTCVIKLPTTGVLKKGQNVEVVELANTFAVGDAVKVSLGYDNNNTVEFEGYLARIKAKIPLELECEDEMWNLKRQNVQNQAFTGTLKGLIEKIAPSVVFSSDFPEVSLKNFIIKDATVAQVLQKIKENYLLAVYFTGKTLYCGLPYLEQSRNQITSNFDFQKNVVSDDLEYKLAKDTKLKAKATSFLPNNTKIETEIGDSDGEQRTLFYRGIQSKQAIETIAKEDLKKYKYDGYKGGFTVFGVPAVKHSQNVQITDPKYLERKGKYVIESVKKTWGVGGYRQVINIGFKVST